MHVVVALRTLGHFWVTCLLVMTVKLNGSVIMTVSTEEISRRCLPITLATEVGPQQRLIDWDSRTTSLHVAGFQFQGGW
jgi:hypothetical protein